MVRATSETLKKGKRLYLCFTLSAPQISREPFANDSLTAQASRPYAVDSQNEVAAGQGWWRATAELDLDFKVRNAVAVDVS